VKAIVMAGGFGTRLRPLTINTPKPMVPIGNLPMMEHVVALLARYGITDVTSLLYFQPAAIKGHFGDGSDFGVNMSYALPDDDYGTAGAVRHALGDSDEPVLIISGDVITDFNLTEAMDWHKKQEADATILLTRVENPLAYGITITDDDGRIVRFLEKPTWGEAFSDTINTGIYILAPSAVQLIPKGINYDFSQDLYPLMLERKMGLYGKVMDGYWKDVGNVDEYLRAHRDIFSGALKLDLKVEETALEGATIHRGRNVLIGEDVSISGTVILGDDVQVEPGCNLHNCAIGQRCRIGQNCDFTDTVVWPDTQIGSDTRAHSAIVCAGARLGANVQLLDNVIVSDECVVGDSATIKANCKIWPSKTVDEGAIVSSSLVWGEKWNRELFTASKVSGLALTEITPDMAVRLGAAFGATLGQGATVVTSRDASDISRLVRRTLMSGLLAAGVDVFDLETMPVPVVRYALTMRNYTAGIYVRHSPADYRCLDFIFIDGSGLDMPTSKLKKVERNYFGEDFQRATMDNIGHLDFPQRILPEYQAAFIAQIDETEIKKAGFKVVIDHSNGASSQVFPTLFSRLGISTTELNANLNPRKFSVTPEERAKSIVQLSAIVKSLNADMGFRLNTAAEQLTVVDDAGVPMDNHLLLLVVLDLYLRLHPEAKRVAVPVDASMGVEEIAEKHGAEVIRVGNDHRAMMEVRISGMVDFVGGSRGGFIFPGFQSGSDAMLSTVHILQMIARSRERFSELRRPFEHFKRRSASVPCSWERKGTVMRRLITETDKKERQLVDGVRIFDNGGWVLISADSLKASFHIFAESRSEETTSALIDRYTGLVKKWQRD